MGTVIGRLLVNLVLGGLMLLTLICVVMLRSVTVLNVLSVFWGLLRLAVISLGL